MTESRSSTTPRTSCRSPTRSGRERAGSSGLARQYCLTDAVPARTSAALPRYGHRLDGTPSSTRAAGVRARATLRSAGASSRRPGRVKFKPTREALRKLDRVDVDLGRLMIPWPSSPSRCGTRRRGPQGQALQVQGEPPLEVGGILLQMDEAGKRLERSP